MFKVDCFIKKNTPELRKKLEDLGYEDADDDTLRFPFLAIDGKNQEHFSVDDYCLSKCSWGIDCGTNEELFLALSALRDDSDRYQWFTTDDCSAWSVEGDVMWSGYRVNSVRGWHKANPGELIERFTGRKQHLTIKLL